MRRTERQCQGGCISRSHELNLQDGWALQRLCVCTCVWHTEARPVGGGSFDNYDNSNNRHLSGTFHAPGTMLYIL